MKKCKKMFMLCTLLLISVQGSVASASEILSSHQENNSRIIQSDFSRKELPRVSVTLKELPKKNSDTLLRIYLNQYLKII